MNIILAYVTSVIQSVTSLTYLFCRSNVFPEQYKPTKELAMMTKVVIVAQGDPQNKEADYWQIARNLRELIDSVDVGKGAHERTFNVQIVGSEKDALLELLSEGCWNGCLVFVSSYFVQQAEMIAKKLYPRHKVLVYTVGLHQGSEPLLISRGMLVPENIRAFF